MKIYTTVKNNEDIKVILKHLASKDIYMNYVKDLDKAYNILVDNNCYQLGVRLDNNSCGYDILECNYYEKNDYILDDDFFRPKKSKIKWVIGGLIVAVVAYKLRG